MEAGEPVVGRRERARPRRSRASASSAARSTVRRTSGSSPTARRWRRARRARSAPRSRAARRRPGAARAASRCAPSRPGSRSAWSRSRWRPASAPRRSGRSAAGPSTMMTGSSMREYRSRRRARTSRPLISGISTSSSTRAIGCRSIVSRASRPLAATTHLVAVPAQTPGQHVAVHLGVVDDEKRGLSRRAHDCVRARSASIFAEQPRQLDRLGVVVVAAGLQRADPVAHHGVRGQGDDRDVPGRGVRLQQPGRLPAVDLGQVHVHEDQVRQLAPAPPRDRCGRRWRWRSESRGVRAAASSMSRFISLSSTSSSRAIATPRAPRRRAAADVRTCSRTSDSSASERRARLLQHLADRAVQPAPLPVRQVLGGDDDHRDRRRSRASSAAPRGTRSRPSPASSGRARSAPAAVRRPAARATRPFSASVTTQPSRTSWRRRIRRVSASSSTISTALPRAAPVWRCRTWRQPARRRPAWSGSRTRRARSPCAGRRSS